MPAATQGEPVLSFRRLALPLGLLVVGLPVGIGAVMAMGPEKAPKEASESFMPIQLHLLVPMLIAVWDDARRVDLLHPGRTRVRATAASTPEVTDPSSA